MSDHSLEMGDYRAVRLNCIADKKGESNENKSEFYLSPKLIMVWIRRVQQLLQLELQIKTILLLCPYIVCSIAKCL